MIKYILISFLTFFSLITSCSVVQGDNYNNDKKIKNVYIGMSKEDVIRVMGNKYVIELTSQEENGLLEVIKYYSQASIPYLIHFLDNKVVSFNRFYPPHVSQAKVTIEHKE